VRKIRFKRAPIATAQYKNDMTSTVGGPRNSRRGSALFALFAGWLAALFQQSLLSASTPLVSAFVSVARSTTSARVLQRNPSCIPLNAAIGTDSTGPSKKDVQNGIDRVVTALRKDNAANRELGRLDKVTVVLGYGLQNNGSTLALRFNASFHKTSGIGRQSVPLPFGLGQSNVSEGRGTMVGQVKASVEIPSNRVTSCSVFRDLGYGRSFVLKV
jgi:hypothetical protein